MSNQPTRDPRRHQFRGTKFTAAQYLYDGEELSYVAVEHDDCTGLLLFRRDELPSLIVDLNRLEVSLQEQGI